MRITSGDVETICRALTFLAETCEKDAAAAPDDSAGRWLKKAAAKSANDYRSLADRLENADSIELGD